MAGIAGRKTLPGVGFCRGDFYLLKVQKISDVQDDPKHKQEEMSVEIKGFV